MSGYILLVPAPEHREALLREGPCGSRPPVATRYADWPTDEWDVDGEPCTSRDPEWTFALVLAWTTPTLPTEP